MAKICFLHLSDFHYSKDHETGMKVVVDCLISDLEKLKSEEGFLPRFVVFSGDLVHAGAVEDDFERAYNFLTVPVIDALGLSPGMFFFTPGNHDINISRIDDALDAGVRENCKSFQDINIIIDSLPDRPYYLSRLDNFNAFIQAHPSSGEVLNTPLYRSHVISIDGVSIGLSLLNSCWRATGRPANADYGNLMLGERQIDFAVEPLKDCDLRIGIVHHPLQWLIPMEHASTQRRAFQVFDLLLFGHNHEPDLASVQHSREPNIINHCGCLYQSRDYFNGYSIIDCDLEKNEVTLVLRSYSDKRREFVKAEDILQDGRKTFPLELRRGRVGGAVASAAVAATTRATIPSFLELKTGLNADGRLEVFAVADDGKLWHIWQDPRCRGGWSDWASLGHKIRDMVVVLNRDGLLEVFGIGDDQEVWHIWQDSRTFTGWSNWHSLEGEAQAFQVAQNLDGRLEVFAKWKDGSLRHIWHIPTGWSSWENLEGVIDRFEVSRNSDGRLEVFSQWTDGRRFHIWQVTGAGWSPWHTLGGV